MTDKLSMWAVVELFGHNQIAGIVSEDSIGGCSFVRVDVPPEDGLVGFTKWFGNGAIYSITPTDEKIVRAYIRKFKPSPMTVYMPEIRQLEYNQQGLGLDRGHFMDGRKEEEDDDY